VCVKAKKKSLRVFFFIGASLLLEGCHLKDQVPIIGFDSNGNPTQILIPHKEYTKRLLAYTQTVQDSAIPVLERHDKQEGWSLRSIALGIGINAEISIGPYRVGAFPRCRLIFSNSSNPVMP